MRKKTPKKYANVLNAIKKYADENHGSMPRAVLESICAEHETTRIILQGALGVGLFEKTGRGSIKSIYPEFQPIHGRKVARYINENILNHAKKEKEKEKEQWASYPTPIQDTRPALIRKENGAGVIRKQLPPPVKKQTPIQEEQYTEYKLFGKVIYSKLTRETTRLK